MQQKIQELSSNPGKICKSQKQSGMMPELASASVRGFQLSESLGHWFVN